MPALQELEAAWVSARDDTSFQAELHTLLCDYAKGFGPGPLHEVELALLTAQESRRIMVTVAGLTRIGHTSGWDALAGFLSGLLVTGRPAGAAPVNTAAPAPGSPAAG